MRGRSGARKSLALPHLAAVHALSADKQLLLVAVLVRVTEGDLRTAVGAGKTRRRLEVQGRPPMAVLLTAQSKPRRKQDWTCYTCNDPALTRARGAPRPESWMISFTTPLM